MKIERPDPIVWRLFSVLDEEADELDATFGDVLGAAAIIVAVYVLSMRAELRARGIGDEGNVALGDEAAWKVFQQRTAALIEGKETQH